MELYRTPVQSAVGSAPVLPRRGPFRSAPQPAGMRRGPALPPDGETDSTVLSVLPVSVDKLLSDDAKGFFSDLSRHNLDRLGLAIHHHAHEDRPAHILGHGRPFVCVWRTSIFLNEFAFLFGDFELKRFKSGFCFGDLGIWRYSESLRRLYPQN
jgi:hypothetical protein